MQLESGIYDLAITIREKGLTPFIRDPRELYIKSYGQIRALYYKSQINIEGNLEVLSKVVLIEEI